MITFLMVSELVIADEARATLGEDAPQVLAAAREALAGLSEFTAANIEAVLRATLIDGIGLKPRAAFGAIRVAISGAKVSPPLFESMEILGKETTLARVDSLIAQI